MEGVLLQTVEGLGDSPFVGSAGEMWELLQAEKEGVAREILEQGPLRHNLIDVNEIEPSQNSAQQIEWQHRESLEDRLRHINDAQDRLIDGGYGMCLECGDRIEPRRLVVNPAASLCISCQELFEGESIFRTL